MGARHLYHNEDCTNFFYHHDTTGGRGGAALDRYVDVLAGAGVTTLLCNTNAQLANYRSAAWEAFWDGFDPAGPDDQPFLAGIPAVRGPAAVTAWRRMVTHMRALWKEGVDYPARVIARCRHHGLSPWITLRMNDVHDNDTLAHPIHSSFWRHHPRLYRRGYDGYFARAFDFAHEEVRAHYDGLIDETLERYDLDGLELDFLREPYLFSRGEEEAGRLILTAWIADIRRRVEAAARRRGHAVALGVRSPSRPEAGLALGLDPVEWARRGLLDLVVVSPRWSTVEFDMPLRQWRQLLQPFGVTLAGGLEILVGAHPGAPKRPVTAEEACGAAAQVLHDGADSVYLFNYFQDTDPDSVPDQWPRHRYQQTLRTLSSLEDIQRQARRHVLTFRDIVGPEGTPAAAPLPARGSALAFQLPSGPPPGSLLAELTLGLEDEAAGHPAPQVTANGSAALELARQEGGTSRRLTFRVPAAALAASGPNRIEIRAADGRELTVDWLDLRVFPAGA
ncbi:MAG: hypothetical protein ABIL09_03535 [Gemmatimonadota bacterium]